MNRWLRHPAELRSLGIVAAYQLVLALMVAWPPARNPLCWVAACGLSFLNAVVIHNHMHQGVFRSKRLDEAFQLVLSFGNLYPASANTPAHNLVHHRFEDDGAPDWAAPTVVDFRWSLANLLHFPNVAGPRTFAGVQRWGAVEGRGRFRRQYMRETLFAFGVTGALACWDFWTTLLYVIVPQLWGARGILRINLLQHEGCIPGSRFDHSRNFVGRAFNWVMCNNGFHTIHHDRAGLHWSELPAAHAREVEGRMDPRLSEPSMLAYLFRRYLYRARSPSLRQT